MQNRKSPAADNTVIDRAQHLQLAVVQSSGAAKPLRRSARTVIPLRTASPVLAPGEAQTQSGILPSVRSGFGRTLKFLKRLLARIDLSDFPGSCCG